MIDERIEEQAALHVLGALSPEEARKFKELMQSDPEVKALVSRLNTATGALAGAVKRTAPPPQLRAKILEQVTPAQRARPAESGNPSPWWLPWALATGLAALAALLFVQDQRLGDRVNQQARQIDDLNLLARTLHSATNDLQQTVASLRESNRLANLQIAMLNSLLADAPKTVAVTLWDGRQQNGVFVVQNLKMLPADQDYELWVIDEKQTPVAAGVFHMDASGTARMEFKPAKAIGAAGKFAVTIEAKGGVSSPTLKNLVLASN